MKSIRPELDINHLFRFQKFKMNVFIIECELID